MRGLIENRAARRDAKRPSRARTATDSIAGRAATCGDAAAGRDSTARRPCAAGGRRASWRASR